MVPMSKYNLWKAQKLNHQHMKRQYNTFQRVSVHVTLHFRQDR